MSKKDIRQCRCTKCLHETRDIDISKDEFISVGSSYYHKDCYQTKCDIELVMNIWGEDIDPNVSYSYLRKELNNLIYTQGNSSDYIIFCARRGAKSGRLKHIPGLKYIVNDESVKKSYYRTRVKINEDDFKVDKEDQREPKFNGMKSKPTGFGSIFGGKK